MLFARGLPTGDAPERVCLERPELLTEIAGLYLEAGAEVVTTNTFGANPERLGLHGLADEPGGDLPRRGRGDAALRWGSARGCRAPSDRREASSRPSGRLDAAVASAGFERQAAALAAAGADLLCVETMTDLAEAELAVRAARAAAPGLPVVATMSFEATRRGFFTVMGVTPAKAAVRLEAAGANAVGANCGDGDTMAGIAREFRAHCALPIAVRPNAGLPDDRVRRARLPGDAGGDGGPRSRRSSRPESRLLGGCCGTTPAHIRALRQALDAEGT